IDTSASRLASLILVSQYRQAWITTGIGRLTIVHPTHKLLLSDYVTLNGDAGCTPDNWAL
ncbi:MAG: hypothetical protein ACXWZV_11105, partial [Solirubrobacterales bacterium]